MKSKFRILFAISFLASIFGSFDYGVGQGISLGELPIDAVSCTTPTISVPPEFVVSPLYQQYLQNFHRYCEGSPLTRDKLLASTRYSLKIFNNTSENVTYKLNGKRFEMKPRHCRFHVRSINNDSHLLSFSSSRLLRFTKKSFPLTTTKLVFIAAKNKPIRIHDLTNSSDRAQKMFESKIEKTHFDTDLVWHGSAGK